MTAGQWLAGSAAIRTSRTPWRSSGRLPSAGVWWQLAGMVAFTAGAFACMLAGLQRVGAVRNGIIGVMEPLAVAVLAGRSSTSRSPPPVASAAR